MDRLNMFLSIFNYLTESAEENDQVKDLVEQIALRYIEKKEAELRDIHVREENIQQWLHTEDLKDLHKELVENRKENETLLVIMEKLFKQHLDIIYDIGECEIEKIYGYDVLKREYELRDKFNIYQQRYERKLETAKKMEGRTIVKNFRYKEQELSKTEANRAELEKDMVDLYEKCELTKAKRKEVNDCIIELAKGSKQLELLFPKRNPSEPKSQKQKLVHPTFSQALKAAKPIKALGNILPEKRLSVRLGLDFPQFKVSFAPILPKFPTYDPTRFFRGVLKHTELRRSPVIPEDVDGAIKKTSGILKTPSDTLQGTDCSSKTVCFENILDSPLNSIEPTIGATFSVEEISPLKRRAQGNEVQSKRAKVEILDDLVIKTVISSKVERELVTNEKITSEDEHSYAARLPLKRNRSAGENNVSSSDLASKSFMDVFLDISNELSPRSGDSTLVADHSAAKKPKLVQQPEKETNGAAVDSQKIKKPTEQKRKGTQKANEKDSTRKDSFEDLLFAFEPVNKSDETKDPKSDGNNKKECESSVAEADISIILTQAKGTVKKGAQKQSKTPLKKEDSFDDFLSGFDDEKADENSEQSGEEMSFNFFEGNDNTDDVGGDNFSFTF